MSVPPPPAGMPLSFLHGGGEMGARMREFDWTKTPLGQPASWPQSLRSTISMLLPSKAQIAFFWGPDFTVLYNDAYRPVFGAKHPAALGLPGREAWSEIWDAQLHPLLSGVVRTGEAFWAKDLLFALERNGFVEETYFDVSYDPVRVESGDVGGVYCIVTETTERVIGQRRLALLRDLAARNMTARSAREACELAIESLAARSEDVPFAIARLEGGVECATPDAQARLEAAPPESVHRLAIASPGGRAGELIIGHSPRRPFDDQYRSFLDLVADQLSTAVTNAGAYEAERERAESLAELDRAKTAFFSNVSHEFRTPLTLMLGPAEEALGSPSRSLSGDALDTVHRNGLRLLRLVNTLLDFSRIEAGRAEVAFEATDLAEFTTDIASTFRSAFERAGLAFTVDCGPLSGPVLVDREMWEKVVLNLLSNSLKFTFEGGVRLSLHEQGDAVILRVRDSGVGIPEDEMPHLFERFHRVQGARARTHEGSGIGLALVNELVKMHGGSIEAVSERERGTTFTATIPRAGREARFAGGSSAHASRAIGAQYVAEALRWMPDPRDTPETERLGPILDRSSMDRVIVADDNADMRDYVTRLLSDRWRIEACADGATALEAARRQPPALVLADVMMPGLDGFELLRQLQRDPATASIPVILLSARAGEEARIEGLRAGAVDYLAKPFSARELRARIDAMIDLASARRNAESADRAKDEFIAMLGHELRNPLSPILTALQLMRLRGVTGAEHERSIIERQVHHLVGLVDDLLDVSRITQGKVDLRREHLELAEVVGHAIETASPLLEERRHHLDVDVPRYGCSVHGDRKRLSQVLANLLTNAAKYTEPGGSIQVKAVCDGDFVQVSVRDDGTGIDPAMQARIFDMFTQAQQTLERSRGGLGLGLAIVKSLVDLHGGTVAVSSEGVGRGSTFTVRLPLASATGADMSTGAKLTSAVQPRLGTRVLIVDDNRDSAEMLSHALSALGYTTEVAFDAAGALAAADRQMPDVALLDVGLPVISGYELAERLRARQSDRRIVLVAITGYGQQSDKDRSKEAGFDEHLVKPVDIERLARLIPELTGSGRVRDLR